MDIKYITVLSTTVCLITAFFQLTCGNHMYRATVHAKKCAHGLIFIAFGNTRFGFITVDYTGFISQPCCLTGTGITKAIAPIWEMQPWITRVNRSKQSTKGVHIIKTNIRSINPHGYFVGYIVIYLRFILHHLHNHLHNLSVCCYGFLQLTYGWRLYVYIGGSHTIK